MTDEMKTQVAEWKKEHGHVYLSSIGDVDYIYRTLTREDYQNLMIKQVSAPTTFDHDMEVFVTCVLSEYNDSDLSSKGGVVTVISEKIMLRSGFEQVESEEL